MSGTVALVMGVLAVLGTLAATVRLRGPAVAIFPMMMTSWLIGELAVFHLVAQLVAIGVLLAVGAQADSIGSMGIGLLVLSVIGLAFVQRRAARAPAVFAEALRDVAGAVDADRAGASRPSAVAPVPARQAWLPFWFDHAGVETIRDIAYGDHPVRNRLDIHRPVGTAADARCPVLVFVHGGAWVIGNKDQQGVPLLLHLARQGWVCVTINYRLAPRNRWPAQIVDVKQALAWAHEHIAEYGGDPRFVAVAGASAGGHLAALAALTPGDPIFQPGFETADTSVSACIPIYAPFDFTNEVGMRGRAPLRRFLELLVMPTRLADDRQRWRDASPLFHPSVDVVPMFVIQGALDILVLREESRHFVTTLRSASSSVVCYAEVPGAQHAFDVFNSVRCSAAVDAIAQFLTAVRDGRIGSSRRATHE